jgi:hypothetical protein
MTNSGFLPQFILIWKTTDRHRLNLTRLLTNFRLSMPVTGTYYMKFSKCKFCSQF